MAAPVHDETTCLELSHFLEPSEGVMHNKPLAFLSAAERQDLGLYDSDADWRAAFPVEEEKTRSDSGPESPNKIMKRLEHGHVVVVGATVDQLLEVLTSPPSLAGSPTPT